MRVKSLYAQAHIVHVQGGLQLTLHMMNISKQVCCILHPNAIADPCNLQCKSFLIA